MGDRKGWGIGKDGGSKGMVGGIMPDEKFCRSEPRHQKSRCLRFYKVIKCYILVQVIDIRSRDALYIFSTYHPPSLLHPYPDTIKTVELFHDAGT